METCTPRADVSGRDGGAFGITDGEKKSGTEHVFRNRPIQRRFFWCNSPVWRQPTLFLVASGRPLPFGDQEWYKEVVSHFSRVCREDGEQPGDGKIYCPGTEREKVSELKTLSI